jgi:uncharacterized protein (DUF362 family)
MDDYNHLTKHYLEFGKVAIARLSGRVNEAYQDVSALRDSINRVVQAGLSSTPDAGLVDGPFSLRNKSVLIKPNWVMHENLGGNGNECLITHPNFILAVLHQVFASGPAKVILGDAPLQMCQFDRIVTREWRDKVLAIATCPVEFIDLRRTILNANGLHIPPHQDVRPMDRYVFFDLGENSLLEPISTGQGGFRITCYNPDQLAEYHRPGRHQYLLCREAFEADVIINLPKLKTHKKAGVTAALKNLVGLNGNKEYLPHHRVGGSWVGGDCYPGLAPLKRLAEYCGDEANRRIGTHSYRKWQQRFARLLRFHGRFGFTEIEGGWYGNDTVWRMTLDLNRLLLYGRADGTMAGQPQRVIYSITDAIIAGEGNGPLNPSPVEFGVVTFSMSSPFADLVHAILMGYDWRKIPLIVQAFQDFRYPLTLLKPNQCEITCDDKVYALEEITSFGRLFRPPSGWAGHIERRG